jgi:hypothetical protein
MAEPPLLAGAVNATVAVPLPAVAVPMVGAPGATALMANDRVTVGAAVKLALPAWSALIEQVPVVRKVTVPALVIVHTAGVDDVKATVRPEDAVAVSVGVVPKLWAAGLANVIVCAAFGVTALEAADGALVPVLLVAVTVKVYAVPLVKPVTVIGLPAPVAVTPPGLAVTV